MRYKLLIFLLLTTLGALLMLLYFCGVHPDSLYLRWGTVVLAFLHVLLWIVLIRQVLLPLSLLENGLALLRAQDFSSRLARVGQRDADQIVSLFNEMIERLRQERLLVQETNMFLSLLIDASPMGVVLLDLQRTIKSLNPAAYAMLEMESDNNLIGKDIAALPLLATLAVGESKTLRHSGAQIYRYTHLVFRRMGMQNSFYLIESLTDEVRKAERTSYEKVIRMLAHEVNNSVAGIDSTLQILRDILKHEPDVVEAIEASLVRSHQLSSFVGEIASVVRIPMPQLVEQDIVPLIERTVRFMQSSCANRCIDIEWSGGASYIVPHDEVLLSQVLVNILKNAIESCMVHDQGHIVVAIDPTQATLTITDNGAGISEEVAPRLFTPFFSAKNNGQGIGLLFISDVLDKHGFDYTLRTDLDRLTRFTIHLNAKRATRAC